MKGGLWIVFFDPRSGGNFLKRFHELTDAVPYAHEKAPECLRKPIVKWLRS